MKKGEPAPLRVLVLDGRMQSCLPLLKALRGRGHEVIVGESDPLSVGFFSRYAQGRFRHRDLRRDPQGFLEDLEAFLRRRKCEVLIPILDVTAELVARARERLAPLVGIPLPEHAVFLRARDKSRTMRLARSLGLPTPKTYDPAETELPEIARQVDYPALIKPNFSLGARGITRVHTPAELLRLYPLVTARYGPCTVQEYIPHSGGQYKAQIFLDRRQEVKACVVCQKLRYFPPSGGSGALFVTVKYPAAADLGIRLLKGLGWVGYGDIDFILDPRDGELKIMEVNPRLSAPVKICFEAGVDIAEMLLRFALGMEIPEVLEYRENIYLRHDGLDLMWFLHSKDRFHTHPHWFRFFGRNIKYQIMDRDDPLPIFIYLLANLRDVFIKESRQYKFQRTVISR